MTAGHGRPQWILSTYGPGRAPPASLLEDNEYSFEELRLRFYELASTGKEAQANQEAGALWTKAEDGMRSIAQNADNVIKFMEDANQKHPNRYDFCQTDGSKTREELVKAVEAAFPANSSGFSQSATTVGFGKPAFGQPSATPGFGQSPFGQPTQSANPFAQPAQPAQSGNPFVQPAPSANPFAQPGATSGFGPPAFGQSGFGQPSQPAASGFGPSSQPAFGAPSFGQPTQPVPAFGQPSQSAPALGQPAQAAQSANPFAQPAQPAQSANPFAKPSATGFGQPSQLTSAFWQPSQPAAAFGQPSQPAPTAFGQPTAPGGFGQSAFGQPSQPAAGGFGQPSQIPSSGFGQPSQPVPSAFGQPSQTSAFGAKASSTSQFIQPAATTGGFGQPSNPIITPAFGSAPTATPAFSSTPNAQSAQTPNPLTNQPPASLHYTETIPKRAATYTGRTLGDSKEKEVQSYAGRRVQYIHGAPCYERPDGKGWERIWFPDFGNGADVLALNRPEKKDDLEGKGEAYTQEVKQAYVQLFTKGWFGEGGMPTVPPLREWCAFDF